MTSPGFGVKPSDLLGWLNASGDHRMSVQGGLINGRICSPKEWPPCYREAVVPFSSVQLRGDDLKG